MAYEYKLPSLGDGVTGKVTEILVKPGDKVAKDQIVLVIGTDKVDAEMPVDQEGTVSEILVKKGDEVGEGTVVLRLETSSATPVAAPAPAPQATPAAPAPVSNNQQTSSMASYEFKLPSLGEGVTGKITEILIKPGDKVTKDQIILVVGTDKVDAEMPIDADGTIEEILVKKGDDVSEGTLVLRMKSESAASVPAAAPAAAAPAPAVPATQTAPAPAAPAAQAAPATSQPATGIRVSPLARKRAKELGINLSDVRPAEGASRISYKDVVDFVKRKIDTGGGSAASAGGGIKRKPLPDFSKFGETERKAQNNVAIKTAEAMSYSTSTIPQAWISEKADITK
ncbi:MAG: E3 binding domain-containing protein, partial [Saprospiraceae bacterium]|nr:E3 binding domain-containing protein [Saprospiraceae bacterium]